MQSQNKRLSILSLFLTFALDSFGIAIIFPIFTPLFLNPNLHFFSIEASHFERIFFLGVLIAFFPISQFFGAPLIGDLSDQIGRKKAFILSITGSIIGYITTAIGIYEQSLYSLFLGRLICGFFAGNATICLAALSDISASEQERSKNYGLISAAGGISFFCAIFIGGFFSHADFGDLKNPSLPFLFTAGLFLLNLITLLYTFKETHPTWLIKRFNIHQGIHHIFSTLKIPKLRHCYLVYFFFTCAWMSSMQFFPNILLNTYSFSERKLTLSFLFVGLIWSFSNFVIQRYLAKHMAPQNVLRILLPLLAVILISCFFPQSAWSYLLHYNFAILIAALNWSNSLTYVSLQASADVQGRILGINQSFGSIASLTGALGGGFIAAIYPKLILISSATLCLLAFWMLQKNKNS